MLFGTWNIPSFFESIELEVGTCNMAAFSPRLGKARPGAITNKSTNHSFSNLRHPHHWRSFPVPYTTHEWYEV
jgi:hypothetical protein